MDEQQAGIDMNDPIVAGVSWLITYLLGRFFGEHAITQFRHALPVLAVLAGVAVRAILEVTNGEPLSFEVLLRGGLAGAVAVTGHSQYRELLKLRKQGPGNASAASSPTVGAILLLILLLPSGLSGCATKNYVVRNLDTLVAEQVSALTRQELAAEQLRAVAACVRDGKTFEDCGLTCESLVAPALRIDHRAETEAFRAVWLAGGVYPIDGVVPPDGTDQPEPADPGPFDPSVISTFCAPRED